MMNNLLKATVAVLLLSAAAPAQAQKVGIKTNLLYWATGTINLGTEFALGPKTTLDLEATGNPFTFDKEKNQKLLHWSVQPEMRFWFCEAFNRGFLGIHATAGAYDVGAIDLPLGILPNLKDHRYEGWAAGVGASYGWQWYLGPHWNLEATFGFGYMYSEYNRFGCKKCDAMDSKNAVKHYFGPTKIGLSLSYLIKSKK